MEKWKIVLTKLLHGVYVSQTMFGSREYVFLPWGFLGKETLMAPPKAQAPESSLVESMECILSFLRQSRHSVNVLIDGKWKDKKTVLWAWLFQIHVALWGRMGEESSWAESYQLKFWLQLSISKQASGVSSSP